MSIAIDASAVTRATILLIVVAVISNLQWPDITPYLVYIQQLVNMLYYLNYFIDMDGLFQVSKYILGIELIIMGKNLYLVIAQFVASGRLTNVNRE